MEKKRHPFQSFALKMDEMERLCVAIRQGASSYNEIAMAIELNTPKVEVLLQWAHHLGLVEDKALTWLGKELADKNTRSAFSESLQEVMYYDLCQNHVICGLLVNRLAYRAAFSYPSEFSTDEGMMLLDQERGSSAELSASSTPQLAKGLKFALNALSEDRALGYVSGVVKGNANFPVSPRFPSWRGAITILFSSLRPGQVTLKLADIASEEGNIGRLFRLDEAQVLSLLRELEGRGYIQIHTQGGLNQVMVNKNLGPEGIWREVTE